GNPVRAEETGHDAVAASERKQREDWLPSRSIGLRGDMQELHLPCDSRKSRPHPGRPPTPLPDRARTIQTPAFAIGANCRLPAGWARGAVPGALSSNPFATLPLISCGPASW